MQKSLIVMDEPAPQLQKLHSATISFTSYLSEYPKINEPKTRVINLCDTEKYLSKGYYCSLLAESRNHAVFPSVRTINEMRGGVNPTVDIQSLLGKKELALLASNESPSTFMILMGVSEVAALQKLATRVFQQYPVPILKITFNVDGPHITATRASFNALNKAQQEQLFSIVHRGVATSRAGGRSKGSRWDMAILVNEQEKNPPSNKRAIAKFVKAAANLGIRATVTKAEELIDINRFDALFIRETTAIDHHTYRLACEAESNGLVVIDDPTSILRCCNKVFLHDAFSYQKVPSLSTEIIDSCSESKLDALEEKFAYPMVLKMPEGSFSQGVYRVDDREALTQRLDQLLQNSALALVQEYLYTEYDWRIGILNGRPLYACRYYMAPKHWQIYNHGSKKDSTGDFESMPTFEVPKPVLDAALRACKVVGNGFYGVDIKMQGDHAFVIEVNDNPSIEHKIEDAWLGEELYMQVMSEFYRRLELRGR